MNIARKITKLFRCDCIEEKEIIEEEWKKCKNDNAMLIDVRSFQEYEEGYINGAISIPYYELNRRAKDEIGDFDRKIILYCNTGYRSKKAANILRRIGYNDVNTICKNRK